MNSSSDRIGWLFCRCVGAFSAMLMSSAACAAPEYLESVTSEVYEANGNANEIAARAEICISQHLAPGMINAPLIISKDYEQGVVVARSAAEYGGMPRWKIRSTFTFEARSGRFRIQQTNLERFYNTMSVAGWDRIPKAPGSQWKGAQDTFAATADLVAQCVIKGPKREDW